MSISLLGFQLARKKELDRLRAQISDLQEESQAQVAELTRQLCAAQGERAALEQAAHDTRDSSQAKLPAQLTTRSTPRPWPTRQDRRPSSASWSTWLTGL